MEHENNIKILLPEKRRFRTIPSVPLELLLAVFQSKLYSRIDYIRDVCL